jgi:predicted GIY-YIG superfamily endonuclease
METLYILECEDDKWYVGKTNDVARRFKQHQDGKGSAWTKEYKPIRIAETRQIVSSHDETNVTKDLMKKYGVDNVRGGAYAQVKLSEDVASLIKHELKAKVDACYTCGKKGHFANRCPNKDVEVVWECDHCEEQFSTEAICQKHEKRCGGQVDARGSTQRSYGSCYKCGRKGHWAPDCYARTHVKGYELD